MKIILWWVLKQKNLDFQHFLLIFEITPSNFLKYFLYLKVLKTKTKPLWIENP